MTTKRLAIAVAVAVIGLGTVFALPRKEAVGEAGITLSLPDSVGDWTGQDAEVLAKEREVLGKDTEFARKVYRNSFGDIIFVSIVLSGHDMMTSIHRPERCLPAQGWNVVTSQKSRIPLASGRSLETTRLFNTSERMTDKGQRITIRSLNYYWFVGSHDLTADHLQRTIYDIRDRVLYGQNQRWAYVTVAATISEGLVKFGRNEADTQKMIEDFIPRVVPSFQQTGVAAATP